MSLPAGTRFGPYEVLAPLGAGGMGEVYRARDTRLERDVAIKVLHTDRAVDPDRIRRFEQEARAAGRLNHPNIVSVYDIGQVPDGAPSAGAPFLVMELLDGRTLREELIDHRLAIRTALTFAREIAEGLAAAHDQGIVHRDLKPENLFVTRDGHIKILDFGLAKLRATDADANAAQTATAGHRTESGVVLGTTGYMSPEQVRALPVDHRSDVFAFGLVLYEMLTGRRAFQGATGADTMSAILHAEPPPMTESGAAVPSAVERVVRRCLEKSPERRFQSARDLAFSFETMSESGGGVGAGERQPARKPQRRWLTITALAVPIVAIAAWAIFSAMRNRPAPESAPAGPPSLTPFLVGEAVETLPAWSPAGNLVAYVSDAAGNEDVWISDLSGANPINLTKDHAGQDSYPAWAPDGQRIAFFSDRDGGGIFTMTPLGSDVRKVVAVPPGAAYAFSLQWAANGSLVYMQFDEAGEKQIYRVPAAEGRPECLTCGKTPVIGARAGELSPSGYLLAYAGSPVGPRAPVSVLDLRTGRTSAIADLGDQPHWLSDSRLAYVSAQYDLNEIGVDPTSGATTGAPVGLTSGLDATRFAVSSTGRVLAVREKRTSTLWTFPAKAARIDRVSAGVALTTGTFRDARPRWSVDGREVYFESTRRGSVQVWKVPSAGGAPVRVTSGTGVESRPRPSPDGRWVMFDSAGVWMWLMRPDGSGSHAAADWSKQYSLVADGSWSPDGSKVAAGVSLADGAARLGIADVDAESGTLRNLKVHNVPGGGEEYPRWSPDGRSIAYESFSQGSWNLWIVNADGESPRPLTTLPGNERQAAWQASPLFVYYVSDDGVAWRIPMTNPTTPAGPPVQWLALPRLRVANDSIDISRDNTRVVVALVKPESDVWLVERK